MKAPPGLRCPECGRAIVDAETAEVVFEPDGSAHVGHVPYACPRWRHRLWEVPPLGVTGRGTMGLSCYLGRAGLAWLFEHLDDGDLTDEAFIRLVRVLYAGLGEEAWQD